MNEETEREDKNLGLDEFLGAAQDIARKYGTSTETIEKTKSFLDKSFREKCLKLEYLDHCEPAYCAFRISGECDFPAFASGAVRVLEEYSLTFDPLRKE